MFNLYEDTKHDAGIIIYENGEGGVFNWAGCNDNQIPHSGTVWQLGERRIITIDTWN